MANKQEVVDFLKGFHTKMKIWQILYRDDRGKNAQTLADLEIAPRQRDGVIAVLKAEDYSEGPVQDGLNHGANMMVFGKMVKGREVYIKVTMGVPGSSVVCISFHIAERPMRYPFKNN